jgi:hypothetical protein
MPLKELYVTYITLFDRTHTASDAEIPRSKESAVLRAA